MPKGVPVVRKTKEKVHKTEQVKKRKNDIRLNKEKYEENKGKEIELDFNDYQKDQLSIIRELAKNSGFEVIVKGRRNTDEMTAKLTEREEERQKQLYNQYQRKQRFLRNSPYYLDYKDKILSERQIVFLTTLLNNPGNVNAALKKSGIKMITYRTWKRDNAVFKEELNNIDSTIVDEAMTALRNNIAKGKEKSVFRVLDTLGVSRGLSLEEDKSLSSEIAELNLINLNAKDGKEEIVLSADEYRDFIKLTNNQKEKEEDV